MVIKLFDIIVYEVKRYIWSNRGYFLLLTSTLPMLLFLTLTAEQIDIQKVVLDPEEAMDIIQSTLLIGYANFVYLIAILISIVVVGELIGGENSLEILVLSTSRTSLITGKIVAILTILAISQIFSLFSFFSILITYNVPIPALDKILTTWLIGLLVSIVPLSFAFFSSALTLRLNMSSHTSAYFTIFIFFIIPSIIYTSLFELGGFILFQRSMLDLTINIPVQEFIVNSLEFSSFFGNEFVFLFSISVILSLSGLILFETSPIH
jgi:hypothetical protein